MTDKTALKLWLQLAKTSADLHTRINTRFRADYGQSLVRFDVLSQLARADDYTLSVGALSAALIASSGNITRLLDRMQNEGMLERRPAPHDRRSTMIIMTPTGLKLFERMAHDHACWIAEILGDIPIKQQGKMVDNLHAIQRALSKAPSP